MSPQFIILRLAMGRGWTDATVSEFSGSIVFTHQDHESNTVPVTNLSDGSDNELSDTSKATRNRTLTSTTNLGALTTKFSKDLEAGIWQCGERTWKNKIENHYRSHLFYECRSLMSNKEHLNETEFDESPWCIAIERLYGTIVTLHHRLFSHIPRQLKRSSSVSLRPLTGYGGSLRRPLRSSLTSYRHHRNSTESKVCREWWI